MWLPQSSTQSNQVALVEKNPSANAGDIRDCRFDPWVRTIPRKRAWHGNPLQYSCLENPMDRGACRAPVHRVTKSQTWLTRLSTHTAKGDQPGAVPVTWPPGIASLAHLTCPLAAPVLWVWEVRAGFWAEVLYPISGHLGQGLTMRGGSTITMELSPCSLPTVGSTSHGGRKGGCLWRIF